MSKTVFNKVDYDLGSLMKSIGLGEIGLPDIQRPVDGQQRLTSLYAVIRNIAVVRENFESERIQIAFNPLEEKFEVVDAAILRDKAFLPDISMLWSDKTDVFEILENYLEGLTSTREVTDDEKKKIKKSITSLQNLLSFPFTARL